MLVSVTSMLVDPRGILTISTYAVKNIIFLFLTFKKEYIKYHYVHLNNLVDYMISLNLPIHHKLCSIVIESFKLLSKFIILSIDLN